MPFDAEAPKTPRDNLIALRNQIAALAPEDFNMMRWGECICGYAARMLSIPLFGGYRLIDRIGGALGLTELQARELFIGYPSSAITPTQAVRVLDHLIDTGTVDWTTMDLPPVAPARESELLFA